MDPKYRKTRLSCMVVYSEALDVPKKTIDVYRKGMLNDIETYKKSINKNEKDEKQTENWMDWKQIITHRDKLYKELQIHPENLELHQKYVLLSMMTQMEPRRNLDYTLLLQEKPEENPEQFNYLELTSKRSRNKSYVVYNQYKTAKFYGEQRLEIPNTLKSILLNWIEVLRSHFPDNRYVFVNSNGQPFSSPAFTLFVNKIFKTTNKKVSINMLRHSFVSNYLGSIPNIETIQNVATAMGNSIEKQLEYVKKDATPASKEKQSKK
jgi:hypothetical protein